MVPKTESRSELKARNELGIQNKIKRQAIRVLYTGVGFWMLTVGSCDSSQSEKETISCKADKIHNMTTVFTQNYNLGSFLVKIVA